MTTRYTPGPWIVVEHDHGARQVIIAPSDHHACVAKIVGYGTTEYPVAVPLISIRRANSALIAAAPELLDAAKAILARLDLHADELEKSSIETSFPGSAIRGTLRDAIAKAEGGAR